MSEYNEAYPSDTIPRIVNYHDRRSSDPAGVVLRGFVFSVLMATGLLASLAFGGWPGIGTVVGLAVVSTYVAQSARVAREWERAVVLRMGRFRAVRGPGVFLIVPLLDRVVVFVDRRLRTTDFSTASTLTRDTVPVKVDAICFWIVWDVQKAVLEVENYFEAVVLSAQTSLRDTIGSHELADLLTRREELGARLRDMLDAKTTPWGMTISSVEIRDVVIPDALQDAMSRQAQAERERQARIILGTAETEIAAKFREAASAYADNPVALHLRAMNMLYEGLKDKGSMVVVPSSAVDTMNLGTLAGLSALGFGRDRS